MTVKIRELFSSSLKNLFQHKYHYLLTTILLQLSLGTIGRYVLAAWFRFGLRTAGETNLTKDNFWRIIGQTGPFLIMVVYVLLVAGVILAEYLILVYMVASHYRAFSFRDMLRAIRRKLAWLSGPQILLFLAYMLMMIPIGNLGLSSTLLQRFRIPGFVTGELTKSLSGSGLYILVLALVFFLNIRLIYFLPLAVVNRSTPWTNLKQSWQITRHNKLRLILTIGALVLIINLLALVLFIGLAYLFSYLDGRWHNTALQSLFYTLVRAVLYLMMFMSKLAMVEVLINYLIRLDNSQDHSYFTLSEDDSPPFRYPKGSRWLVITIVLGFLAYNNIQFYLATTKQEKGESPLMIAHRGDVSAGVENSIEAMIAANKAGADLVEIDIVMTADRKFVVIHDNRLNRLTGRNWKVSEKPLAELQKLSMSQGDFDSKLSSLEEFTKQAQVLNQPLLIELKLYGHEPNNYAELLVAELNRLKIGDKDQLMSLDIELMEKIEKLAPQIKTGHVIPLHFGNLENRAVDFYVIEDFSYNDLIMLSAENQGKDLYVWTINDEETMAGYLQSSVNGIITDELDTFKGEQQALKADTTYFARVFRLLMAEFD